MIAQLPDVYGKRCLNGYWFAFNRMTGTWMRLHNGIHIYTTARESQHIISRTFCTRSCYAWLLLRRRNERDGVSNHLRLGCLFSRWFRRRSKKTSKLRVTGLYARTSPVTGELPTQRASYAQNISTWWRYHVYSNHLSYKWIHMISLSIDFRAEQWY